MSASLLIFAARLEVGPDRKGGVWSVLSLAAAPGRGRNVRIQLQRGEPAYNQPFHDAARRATDHKKTIAQPVKNVRCGTADQSSGRIPSRCGSSREGTQSSSAEHWGPERSHSTVTDVSADL